MDKILRLILGDQLNSSHSWYKNKDSRVTYVLMEVMQEQTYVKHHVQKIVGFFANMRQFAIELKAKGHHVIYFYLDAPENKQNFYQNLLWLKDKLHITKFEYQLADEYRLDQELKAITQSLEIDHEAFDTEHFFTQRNDVREFFQDKKQYLMENFYRNMRKKYRILVNPDLSPVGEQWNFDHDNRKKYDNKYPLKAPVKFQKDVSDILAMLEKMEVPHFGKIAAKDFNLPIGQKDAFKILNYFCEELLISFGRYEDAMVKEHFTLFHSRLSFALNLKLISPVEVVQVVETYWHSHKDEIDIAQVEGFIRQVIGWREYMRGIYWAEMPAFAEKNFLENHGKLPTWFWDGKVKMNCLKNCIGNSLQYSYAHHIQRLMVIGNFALLAGTHPDEVDEWYLGVYADAVQWVQITNTRGMSQFADGGIVGTKPYVSSANYIDKMSNYCKNCYYDKSKKYGEKACPFNSLYWNFFLKHEDKLKKNPRISMMYKLLDKMDAVEREKILIQANNYLKIIDEL